MAGEAERRNTSFVAGAASTSAPVTDQWRVYSEAVRALGSGTRPLRLFIQASAGTGKSFLLETLYRWRIVIGLEVSAWAPTGIAAARIRIPRTPVRSFSLHYVVGLSIPLGE